MLALHRHLHVLPLGQALVEARRAVADDRAASIAADSFIALGA